MATPQGESDFSSEVEKILAQVSRAIGSIEAPDYRRVKLDSRRYARLVMKLTADYWLRDVTDENSDVASVFALRRDARGKSAEYHLYVSNVAEFAYVRALDKSCLNTDTDLEHLAVLLKEEGLSRLPENVLSVPITAAAFNTDNPRLFNILFSDTEYLPWEQALRHPEESASNDG